MIRLAPQHLSVPVAHDFWTDLAFLHSNTQIFQNFLGDLDVSGKARSVIEVPAGIVGILSGQTITASAIMLDNFSFASRAVTVELR